ncbi:MAG: hypothetical protein ACO2O0_12815 [Desulfurococcales archaeon]
MLSYYGYVDIPVIGDEARMRRFEETLRSMGMIVVEVNVSNTSRIYYTSLPIAREYPPDRSIWWARAIEDVMSKRRSEIYDILLTEAKEMARKSFETVAVFQRGGAKMTVEMLRKGDGVGLTLPHYLVLMYAGEASKVMPLSNPSRPTSAISPWFPYLTPDEEFGYMLARAANESLTWEDYQRERMRICWGATDGRALTDAYTYPGLWAGIKSGKINASEKEIRDICTRFGELLTMRRTSPALALLTKTAQIEWGRHSGLIIWMEPHEQDGFRIFTATIDGDPKPAAELAYEMLKNISTAINRPILIGDPSYFGNPVGDYELATYALENGKPHDYYLRQMVASEIGQMIGALTDKIYVSIYISGSLGFKKELLKILLEPVAGSNIIKWIENANTEQTDKMLFLMSAYRGWMTKIYIYVDVEPYDEFIKSIDTGKTVLIVENFSTSREYDSMYKSVIDTFWDLVYKIYYDGKLPAGYLYWGINDEPPRYEVRAVEPPRDPPKSFDYQVLFVAPGVSKAVG